MLTRDGRILFGTRSVRLFAYGMLSVVLTLYLAAAGMTERQIGLLLSLTLAGDIAVSLLLTTRADRWGRRRTLMVGAVLMMAAAAVFVSATGFAVLAVAAIVGVISPSGGEVGPFLAVEQAALAEETDFSSRTRVFAWYNLCGSVATAVGALLGGLGAQWLIADGSTPLSSYRVVIGVYGATGLVLVAMFTLLSEKVEARPSSGVRVPTVLGVHKSARTVFGLSSLFALDAFGGGFIVQSLLAYWFHLRFGADAATLGGIFFWANLLAGVSALAAAALARRIGLLNTMVFTHLPSNVLLMLVPLMPTLPLAVGLLLVRFSISQMDVPTRQAYVVAVVDPDERSGAQGITGVARSVGASVSPAIAGALLGVPGLINVPLYVAGGLKVLYDLLLLRRFSHLKPEEERSLAGK